MSNVLVTGINGFVGKHLARELHSRDHTVIGVGKAEDRIDPSLEDIVDSYHQCDLVNKEEVSRLPLDKLDGIINLAGLAAVGPSFDEPDLYMKVNVGVLSTVGELLLKEGSQARIVAVSSGALYDPNQEMPLTEASKTVKKSSPYALSKLEMERCALDLQKRGLDIVIVRPFNHIGPGQEKGFLLPDMYAKIKNNMEAGEPVLFGNLATRRDYTDVRDIVKAYSDLATNPTVNHSLYNVCSGKSISGDEMLSQLCSAMGIGRERLQVEVDKDLIRPNDPKNIFGDNSRLHQETGWVPHITLEKTIHDFVEEMSS
jgi:GDP-4-dehydro-6-deoxy-D-mannose reductase